MYVCMYVQVVLQLRRRPAFGCSEGDPALSGFLGFLAVRIPRSVDLLIRVGQTQYIVESGEGKLAIRRRGEGGAKGAADDVTVVFWGDVC